MARKILHSRFAAELQGNGTPGMATIPAIRNNSWYSASLNGEIMRRTALSSFTFRKAGLPRISASVTGRGSFSYARKSATQILSIVIVRVWIGIAGHFRNGI